MDLEDVKRIKEDFQTTTQTAFYYLKSEAEWGALEDRMIRLDPEGTAFPDYRNLAYDFWAALDSRLNPSFFFGLSRAAERTAHIACGSPTMDAQRSGVLEDHMKIEPVYDEILPMLMNTDEEDEIFYIGDFPMIVDGEPMAYMDAVQHYRKFILENFLHDEESEIQQVIEAALLNREAIRNPDSIFSEEEPTYVEFAEEFLERIFGDLTISKKALDKSFVYAVTEFRATPAERAFLLNATHEMYTGVTNLLQRSLRENTGGRLETERAIARTYFWKVMKPGQLLRSYRKLDSDSAPEAAVDEAILNLRAELKKSEVLLKGLLQEEDEEWQNPTQLIAEDLKAQRQVYLAILHQRRYLAKLISSTIEPC